MSNPQSRSCRSQLYKGLLFLAVVSCTLLFAAGGALAATVTVTNGGDSGFGTLRQAIIDAAIGDTIKFAAGITTVTLTTDQLVIDKDLKISGPGANLLSVKRSSAVGTPTFRIFRVLKEENGVVQPINVTLSGLTITNGRPDGDVHVGGGINNAGTLTITGCTISGNVASSQGGGGIYNQVGVMTIMNSTISGNTAIGPGGGISSVGATMTITNSTISGNLTNVWGGGIRNQSGTMTMTNSTVSDNSGSNGGGGIFNNDGTMTITKSTVSGNSVNGGGGGIYNNEGTMTISNSTLSGNSGTGGNGGGLWNSGSTMTSSSATITSCTISGNTINNRGGGISTDSKVTATNTIIAQNSAPSAPDFDGTLISQGWNLIGNPSGTTITGLTVNNQLNVNPNLGALQNNGGPTFTQALLPGSPAIDAGNSSGSNTNTEQRGFGRKVDSPSIANASSGDGTDIGAYEVQSDSLPGCGNGTVVSTNLDNGPGSLRQILAGTCGGETITFSPSVVSPINLTSGELGVSKYLIIQGPGANLLTIQRAPNASINFCIFHVTSGAEISGLTITKGNPPFGGGGISRNGFNTDLLTVRGCVISENSANNTGQLTANGGGISAANLMLIDSTVTGNSATADGGGINGGPATIVNSTISGNFAARYGGGLNVGGTMTLQNSTVSNNTSITGGGLRNSGVTVNLRNTIIAKNAVTGSDPDISGPVTSQGFNFIGNNFGSSITPAQATDQIGTPASPKDPFLGPLQNNGGPTLTRALLSGSTAIDKGESSGAGTDQRGFTRPVNFPALADAQGGDDSDIGAFEVAGTPPSPTQIVSRKAHGGAGLFDITLSLTGTAGIECRTGGANGDYQVVVSFAVPVTLDSAAVSSGNGSVSDAVANGNQVTVNLTGVANAQRITIRLSGVSDSTNIGNLDIPMSVLLGDTTGNGTVNASDVSQTKLQSGNPVTVSNFREDVTASGTINASDVSTVKLKSGTALP